MGGEIPFHFFIYFAIVAVDAGVRFVPFIERIICATESCRGNLAFRRPGRGCLGAGIRTAVLFGPVGSSSTLFFLFTIEIGGVVELPAPSKRRADFQNKKPAVWRVLNFMKNF